MGEQVARIDGRTAKRTPAAAPKPAQERDAADVGDLMELQRTVGNRAVAESLAHVQRHRLNPEEMG